MKEYRSDDDSGGFSEIMTMSQWLKTIKEI